MASPLYASLVGIFRDCIAPSGGNNDKIRGHLVPLLAFAHECATNSGSATGYKLDAMDYIYHEKTDAMINKLSIPYAPFIMMLVRHMLPHEDFGTALDGIHKPKKIYNKAQKTHHPSTAPESFMRDARASGRRSTVSPMAREVKQLNWFQRNILCMGIDIHKGQYEAYRRDHERDHTQQLILHHVSGATGHPPPPTAPDPYAQWNTSGINYGKLESCLFPPPPRAPTPPADDDDDEYDEEEGDGDDYDEDEEE